MSRSSRFVLPGGGQNLVWWFSNQHRKKVRAALCKSSEISASGGGRAHLDTPTGPERGLSSPQQRRTAGGLQALTGTVGRPRVAADWKVPAPVAVPRCDRLAWERRSPTRPVG